MQEIFALDTEIKRLKELKAIHKEFRRYVEMPSINISLIFPSWSDVPTLYLLQRME